MACGILVPSPGMEPASPAVDVWSVNHWASREIPHVPFNSGLLESYCPSPRELLSLWKLPVSVTSWYRLCFKIIASLKSHQLFGNLNFLYDFSVYKTYTDRCILIQFSSVQFSSVTQWCPTLCNPMNHSTSGLPVHHQLPEFTQKSCASSR